MTIQNVHVIMQHDTKKHLLIHQSPDVTRCWKKGPRLKSYTTPLQESEVAS